MKIRYAALGLLALLFLFAPSNPFHPETAYASPATAVTLSADINISSSGDNTVITGVTAKRIVVWKMWLVANGAVNLKFEDGTTAFNASAIHLTADGSSIFFPFDTEPYWTTTAGNAFTINLSGATQVSGRIYYTLVTP